MRLVPERLVTIPVLLRRVLIVPIPATLKFPPMTKLSYTKLNISTVKVSRTFNDPRISKSATGLNAVEPIPTLPITSREVKFSL